MFPKPSFPISLHLRYEMKKLRSQDCALFMSNYLKMSSVTLWFSKRQTSAPKMSLSTVQMTGPDFAFSTLVLLSKRWVENRLRIKYLTCVKLAKKKKEKASINIPGTKQCCMTYFQTYFVIGGHKVEDRFMIRGLQTKLLVFLK